MGKLKLWVAIITAIVALLSSDEFEKLIQLFKQKKNEPVSK
jgi:hypothetical protein